MPGQSFTILDGGRPAEVAARVEDGHVWLAPESVQAALGWDVTPQGLCRSDVCVPLPREVSMERDGIDLTGVAAALRRPLAVDLEEAAACLGVSAEERGNTLATLWAPDFTLPDLEGRLHTLSDQRGKKVLLVAYASW